MRVNDSGRSLRERPIIFTLNKFLITKHLFNNAQSALESAHDNPRINELQNTNNTEECSEGELWE